jgi:lysozyme family protein
MSNTRIKVVQHVLGLTIDGISGPRTIQAIKNFQSNNKLVPDGLVGNKTISAMSDKILELEAKNIDTELFYIELRKSGLFKSLTQSRVNGINTILSVIKSHSITEQSYMLATIYHECATTMLPISEYGKGKRIEKTVLRT